MKTSLRQAFEDAKVNVASLSDANSMARRVLHILNRQDEQKESRGRQFKPRKQGAV